MAATDGDRLARRREARRVYPPRAHTHLLHPAGKREQQVVTRAHHQQLNPAKLRLGPCSLVRAFAFAPCRAAGGVFEFDFEHADQRV